MSKVLKGNCVSIEQPSVLYCEEPRPAQAAKASQPERAGYPKSQQRQGAMERAGLILDSTFEKAGGILEKANEDALKIIKKARQEAEEIYRDAYENGLREGREAGEKAAIEQESGTVEELRELLRRLSDSKTETEKNLREEALDFAFSLASKIIDTEIDRNDEAYFNLCAKAAMHTGEAVRAVLRVGPREYVIASKYEKELQKCLGGLQDFEIELDETKNKAAACIIETDSGMVDASVDTQLRRARELIDMSQ